MTFLEEVKAYVAVKPEIQLRYEEYIKDKSIPLDDRWNVFCAAPADWKEQEDWFQHFEIENIVGEIFYYDEFGIERNQTVFMEDLMKRVEGRAGDDEFPLWTEEVITKFKEEVLQKNMCSFIYDW